MSTTKPLSVAQLLILTTAAQRPDQMVLPLPPLVRARGGAQRSLLGALLKLALVEELSVNDAALAWRTDEAGQKHGLRITAAGLIAAGACAELTGSRVADVGLKETSAADADQQAAAASAIGNLSTGETSAAGTPSQSAQPRRPAGKMGEVLQAISAQTGATLAEITALTGWLPHTARAAVTGLRKRGFSVALLDQNGRKAYRLTLAG